MLSKTIVICLGAVVFLAINCHSANILYLTGLPSPSHHIWNRALANRLAENGHNVTVTSTDFEQKPRKNVTFIHFEGVYELFGPEFRKAVFYNKSSANLWSEARNYINRCVKICEGIMNSNGVQQLMAYPDNFRFDAVLYDYTCGPCLLPFLEKFNNPPLISVTAFNNPPFTNALTGGHQYYAYIPYYGLNTDERMSFWTRGLNALLFISNNLHRQYLLIPRLNNVVRKQFGKNLPSVGDIERRTLLAMVSTNPVLGFAEPLGPNVIPVAGLHIQEPKKLPEEIDAFINSSKKGAVLFSLGTNLRSDMMDVTNRQKFLDAFRQLPDYHIFWKFESANLLGNDIPKNVMVNKWLPQSDILAHPRTKAFFTHGGLLSVQESIWHGVPMIGMPFMFDQLKNIFKAKQMGIAEIIDFYTMTTEEVRDKIRAVCEHPSYSSKMQQISHQFRDQKEKPVDRAVWWVEWAIRNPDAHYIRSPVLELGVISGNCYDLMAFAVVVPILLFFLLRKLLKILSIVTANLKRNICTKNKELVKKSL